MMRRILGAAVVLLAGCGVAAAQADLEGTLSLLKGAEAQKNVDQIKSLAVECITGGRKDLADAKPDEKDRLDFDKSVQEYGEYALLNAATQAPAATKVDLLSTLEQNSPKSKYLESAYLIYLQALRDTGAAAKVPDIAEKALTNFPEDADLLATCLDSARSKNQADKVLAYANRLVAAAGKATKPEGVPDADWEKTKASRLGIGYLSSGSVQFSRNQFIQADKDLRAALPYIKGNDSMYGMALLYLGVANYQIGKATNLKARVQQGADFCTQSSKVSWPQAQEAWRQAQLISQEAAKMR